MIENDFELGTLLKTLRKEKETTRSLSKKIGYSHSYISSVENGSKQSPSNEFIQKYLLAVNNKNIKEANYYIDLINKLSSGNYSFERIPFDDDMEEVNEKLRKINENFSNTHLFVSSHSGKYKVNMFEEPINDLSFHLNELDNMKYFKGIRLDIVEREEISNMITKYLSTIYVTQIQQTHYLYTESLITKEQFMKYCSDYYEALEKLEADDEKYNDLKGLREFMDQQYSDN